MKWIFGITASSEKKEAAKAFLSYFLSSENMDQYDWTLSVNKTSFRKNSSDIRDKGTDDSHVSGTG